MRKGIVPLDTACGPSNIVCRSCKTETDIVFGDAGSPGFVIPVHCASCGTITYCATAPVVAVGATPQEACLILAKAFGRATGEAYLPMWLDGVEGQVLFPTGVK